MKWQYLFALLVLASCKSVSRDQKLRNTIRGEWLIINISSGGALKSEDGIIDSLTFQNGLKLVSFDEQGRFMQMDQPFKAGRWGLPEGTELMITDGHEGFESFRAEVVSAEDNDLRLKSIFSFKGQLHNIE